MSAKSDYQALEAALREIESRVKPKRKGRKRWDPRSGGGVLEARVEFRKLIKEFWGMPSEEDIPSPSNEDLFWNGDSLDREHIVARLDSLLWNGEFSEPGDLTDLVWPPSN